jgi:membrane-bound lytic murein transglycosylase D
MKRFSYKRFSDCLSTLLLAILGIAACNAHGQSTEALKLTKNLSETALPQQHPAIESESTAFPIAEESLTITESDLWSRIRNGYAIPNLENRLVNVQTIWYSARIDYLQRIIQRGSRYLYHVVEALDKRGMPTDLALLPFIESAFNPQAISSAKASGMWQFMPATGRDFNLRQTIFKDDRRGVLDSTEAALDYLQRLYNMFGDWQLALAAYNWGEGSVQRAIKKQQAMGLPIDFDSLSALMPNETKNYVPKLQAVKNIIGHPEQFNIDLPRLDNVPYFTSIKKNRDIDVNLAAQLAELPISEFKALNPQFSRPVITGSNRTTILLPIENAAMFQNNLLTWKGPLSSWTTLNVNKTERVESLATRFGYKPDVVRDVNAIPAKMYVKAGSTILVPKSSRSSEENIPSQVVEQAQLTIEKGNTGTRKIYVKVGKKENLAAIAKRYKLNVADIKEWNNLRKDQVPPGTKLALQVPIKAKTRQLATASKAGNKHSSGKQNTVQLSKKNLKRLATSNDSKKRKKNV